MAVQQLDAHPIDAVLRSMRWPMRFVGTVVLLYAALKALMIVVSLFALQFWALANVPVLLLDVVIGLGLLFVRNRPADIARRHGVFFVLLALRLLMALVFVLAVLLMRVTS